MTSPADQVITALRSGHDDLAAHLGTLDDDDLTGPSGASDWDVAHVLSHLGSGAEIHLATLDRALPGGAPAPEGFNESVWDRWNAMGPAEHRAEFLSWNQRLVERYEGLSATDREQLRIDLGFLPAPVEVADAGRLRLLEFTLHTWDAKAGAEPATTLAPQAVPLLLDALRPLLGWISQPEVLGGRPALLAVELTEPSASYGLVLGDAVSLAEVPEQPNGSVSAPAEAWLRLLTGRLAAESTPSQVQVSGPVSIDDLRRVFPGY